MKKKNIILIVVGLLLIVGVYLGYKCFNLYYYNINNITTEEYEKFIDGFKIKDTITIKNEKLKENQYLTFNNIKVRNDFSDFKELENQYSEEFIKYVLHDENNQLKASFWMGTTDSYVELFKTDTTLFGTEDKRITNTNLSDFLTKNSINNDIELFEFLEKSKDVKNNIFTSVKQMKGNYTIQFLVSIAMPQLDGINLIKGDYSGYILNITSDAKEVGILKDGKKYVFTFFKLDYFTDEYIQEILSTVVID